MFVCLFHFPNHFARLCFCFDFNTAIDKKPTNTHTPLQNCIDSAEIEFESSKNFGIEFLFKSKLSRSVIYIHSINWSEPIDWFENRVSWFCCCCCWTTSWKRGAITQMRLWVFWNAHKNGTNVRWKSMTTNTHASEGLRRVYADMEIKRSINRLLYSEWQQHRDNTHAHIEMEIIHSHQLLYQFVLWRTQTNSRLNVTSWNTHTSYWCTYIVRHDE